MRKVTKSKKQPKKIAAMLSAYEQQRLDNIQRNNGVLEQLGLAPSSTAASAAPAKRKKKKKKRSMTTRLRSQSEPLDVFARYGAFRLYPGSIHRLVAQSSASGRRTTIRARAMPAT